MSIKHTQPVRRHALPNFVLLMLLAWVVSGCATPATAPTTSASEATPVTAESTAENTTESTGETEVSLFPLTITDAVGQEFTFDAPPKIGCDWYGCHEAMADLGIAPTAAGMGVEESTSVFYAPAGPPATLIEDSANPESWAAAGVDLIVTRVPATAENDVLTAAAPIFYLHHPSYGESDQQGYQAYYENLRLLGQLTGQSEAADTAIARFENFLANLRRLATPETEALTVAVLFGGDSYSGLSRENPFCAVLVEVGLGQCPGPEDPEEFWPEVNAEQFLAIDPDWIVYEGFGASYTERTDPVWGQLTAVKEGRVYDAAEGGRSYCCSTRGLIHSLQDYISHILPDAGIPSPGPHLDFDPLTSPLVAAPEGASSVEAQSLFPITITDAAGQEFTFDAPPKIGCMFFGCYETLSDLGVAPQAASAGNPADRGANYYTPGPEPIHYIDDFQNPELWAAAEVDIVVAAAPPEPSNDALAQAAPLFHIYYTAGDTEIPVGLEAFIKNLELFGQLTGKPEAAAAALARYERALEKLRGLATPETAQLQVALLRSRDTYQIYGKETAFCTVIAQVGLGQCLGEGDFITELNAEELLALDPDWIIYVTNNDSYQDRTDPVWLELRAVKEGRVYDTISNRYGCCSLRGLYQPLIEYVSHLLPEAGAPLQSSTADFDPEQNWLVNP